MNIFDTLNRGNDAANQENISSFLAYLLDPAEDHGLKDVFLKKFLELLNLNEQIDPNNFYIDQEYKVNDGINSIDIVLETGRYLIAVENKILKYTIRKEQLSAGYKGLKKDKDPDKKIILCFLTPESIDAGRRIRVDKLNGDRYEHITWEQIIKILEEIIKEKNNDKNKRLNNYTKQTLKAFINFIKFTSEPYEFSVNNAEYRIKKQNITAEVIVEQKTDGKWDVVLPRQRGICAKHIIIDMLNRMGKKVPYTVKSGTTYSLGVKLYKMLKERSSSKS